MTQLGFPCPGCQRAIIATPDQAGSDLVCQACHASVRAPDDVFASSQETMAGPPGVELPTGRNFEIQPKFVPMERPDARGGAERDWGSVNTSVEKNRSPVRLRIGLGLASGAIVAGIFTSFQIGKASREELFAPASRRDVRITHDVNPAEGSVSPHEILNQFLDLESTFEDRLALIREPVDPAKVRDHFNEHNLELASGVESIGVSREKQMLDVVYHGFHVCFRSGDDRYVYVVEEPDGLKIDWDAYARTGRNSWVELVAGDRLVAEMHVFLMPGRYYNFAFSDARRFSMFILTSPDCDEDIFGYTERGSFAEKVILHSLKSGRVLPMQMKLRLESVDGSCRRRQFLISNRLINFRSNVQKRDSFSLDG